MKGRKKSMRKLKKYVSKTAAVVSVSIACLGMPITANAENECSDKLGDFTVALESGCESEIRSTKTYSDDELLYGYMLSESGVTPQPDKTLSGNDVCYESGILAGDKLTGKDAIAYNYLKSEIQKIAAGERTSTEIEIPLEKFGLSTETYYTASDLGVDYIYDSNGYSNDALAAARSLILFDYDKVINALLVDCPYDLYWCDKTLYNAAYGGGLTCYRINGEYCLQITKGVILKLYVSVNYSENNAIKTTILPNDRLSAVRNAIANAQKIVSDNSDKSGKELLKAYCDTISDLTTYNKEAAADENYPYGDPWQLIYVFDGDPNTNVVCEGYAKSFKYLCDLSGDLLPNTSCIIASGYTTGRHMWNVVNMDDNQSYLVDVTAYDTDSDEDVNIPQKYKDTFLLGVPVSGTYDTTYEFYFEGMQFQQGNSIYTINANSYYYSYGEPTLETHKAKYLTLATVPYANYTFVPAKVATCTENGNIAYYTDSDGRYYILTDNGYDEITASDIVISKKGHSWNNVSYTWNSNNSAVTAKRICKYNASHIETETVNATSKITKEATCTEKGETTYSATFSNTAFVKQQKTIANISASGHNYSEPVYEWENESESCKAFAYCMNNGCSDEIEEQVIAVASIKTPATYEDMGWTTYTATFVNSHFVSQVKDIQDIPMLAQTAVVIQFVDINGFKEDTTVYAETFKDSDYILPSAPYLDGYTFEGWAVNNTIYSNAIDARSAVASAVSEKPTGPVKVSVIYKKKNVEYNVTVTGGRLSDGKRNDTVQVSELVVAKAYSYMNGNKFSHWERNGVKVSTNLNYTFRMPSYNVTLTAVYVTNTTTVRKVGTAIIENVTPNADTGKLSFVSVCSVPNGSVMVKAGLVATNDSSIAENVTAENAAYVKLSTKIGVNTKNLKYTWTKSNVTTSWYVRSYLVYRDSEGTEYTVYGNAVKADMTGIIDTYQNGN